MFPLVRFWEHLFRQDVNAHPGEINSEALTDFVHMFKHRGDQPQTSSRIFTLQNLNKILLILTVMDDFFGVDVSSILSRSDNRRLERLKSQAKLSAQSLHTSSSGQLLRPPSKKEEI